MAKKKGEHQAAIGFILLYHNSIYQIIMLLIEPLVIEIIKMSKYPKGVVCHTIVIIERELIKLFLSMIILVACHYCA